MTTFSSAKIIIQSEGLDSNDAKFYDNNGESEHHELSAGKFWCDGLQMAVNLRTLSLHDVSYWAPAFDNMLRCLFTTCTWQCLASLCITRSRDLKMLPLQPLGPTISYHYGFSWYIFAQDDLDAFLLRHSQTLQELELQNIVGVAKRQIPPPLTQQLQSAYNHDGSSNDPQPSIPAFGRSLTLWRRRLGRLKRAIVAVRVSFDDTTKEGMRAWQMDSEIYALLRHLVPCPDTTRIWSPWLPECSFPNQPTKTWSRQSHLYFDFGNYLTDSGVEGPGNDMVLGEMKALSIDNPMERLFDTIP